MKSDNVKKGMQQAPHRSLFNALGYTKEELDRTVEVLKEKVALLRKMSPLYQEYCKKCAGCF